jgi:hypothetical protein
MFSRRRFIKLFYKLYKLSEAKREKQVLGIAPRISGLQPLALLLGYTCNINFYIEYFLRLVVEGIILLRNPPPKTLLNLFLII